LRQKSILDPNTSRCDGGVVALQWLELTPNARQLDEIYTARNKVTPAALAMVMSAQGASLDLRFAG
jgi:hypothetical protein